MGDIYAKAKDGLNRWKEHDIEIGYDKGVPDYPTNVGFVKSLDAELEKEFERVAWNVLHGKTSKIDSKTILRKAIEPFLRGTSYTPDELIEIMGFVKD